MWIQIIRDIKAIDVTYNATPLFPPIKNFRLAVFTTFFLISFFLIESIPLEELDVLEELLLVAASFKLSSSPMY